MTDDQDLIRPRADYLASFTRIGRETMTGLGYSVVRVDGVYVETKPEMWGESRPSHGGTLVMTEDNEHADH